MNSGKIVAGRVDGWTSKVLQEVLADLKILIRKKQGGQKGGGGGPQFLTEVIKRFFFTSPING